MVAGWGLRSPLARRDSPDKGGRHLGLARALVHEMPHTLVALASGALSERPASLIESACLPVERRRALDEEMCADPSRLAGCGDARIQADAKAIAYRLDPQAVLERPAEAAGGVDPPGPGLYGLCDRAATSRPRGVGVCRTHTRSRLQRRRARPPSGHGRHPGGTGDRARGGQTSGGNGQGLCEHCNYVKELAHWKAEAGTDDVGGHTTDLTTPTGQRHHNLAPPILPGRRRFDYSEVETHARITLYDLHAA